MPGSTPEFFRARQSYYRYCVCWVFLSTMLVTNDEKSPTNPKADGGFKLVNKAGLIDPYTHCMGKSIRTAPPLPNLSLDASGQECPECGHERGEPEYSPWAWLARRLGMKPRPAVCDWRVEYEGDACNCPSHFHGS